MTCPHGVTEKAAKNAMEEQYKREKETGVSVLPDGPFSCIVADPPWPVKVTGKMARHSAPRELPYKTMTVEQIAALPVGDVAGEGAHCWLWTTNGFLRPAFDVMEAWGFKYLTTVTWVKPSGYGPWFVSTTQHVLFGYKGKCRFPLGRYKPTHFTATPRRHSEKPDEFYDLAREVSPGPRLDMFNRRQIDGFEGWGDESPQSRGWLCSCCMAPSGDLRTCPTCSLVEVEA